MQHYLEYLKARAKDAHGACHLVSKVTSTETNLVRLLSDPQHLRGYGLAVNVNGHGSKLQLDTGASGILITRGLAEKAGLTRLSEYEIRGIGDKGGKEGYTAVVGTLKIGELEFQGCTVRVLDQRSVIGEDGLIGSDVFSSFLVDLDFPNEKLRLQELPKRPEAADTKLALATDEDDSDDDSGGASKPTTTEPQKDAKPNRSGPQDRYVAPEMKSYTPIYRFGHMLLVPTSVGQVPGKLFLIDSGAFTNHITPAAAREVTKVHGDSDNFRHWAEGRTPIQQVFVPILNPPVVRRGGGKAAQRQSGGQHVLAETGVRIFRIERVDEQCVARFDRGGRISTVKPRSVDHLRRNPAFPRRPQKWLVGRDHPLTLYSGAGRRQ
jgi:hypothetical protein